MSEFNALADRHFAAGAAIRRYETSIVKAEIKNLPLASSTRATPEAEHTLRRQPGAAS